MANLSTKTGLPSFSDVDTSIINIIDNSSARRDTTGWTAASNYTVSRDISNSPLAGVIDTCFAISTTAASSETSTSGVYAAAQLMPAALRNTKVQASIYVNIPATSLGVWRLSIYNASGTRMSLSSDSSGVTTLPGGFTGQFVTTFDADSSASYTASFTQTTRTSANTLYFTNISIGNGQLVQGAAVGKYAQYTASNTSATNGGASSTTFGLNSTAWGTVSSTQFDMWRVGSRLRVTGRWTSGTVGAATARLYLPTSLTIDSTALSTNSSGIVVGMATAVFGTAQNVFSGNWEMVAFFDGSDTSAIYFASTTNTGALVKENAISRAGGNQPVLIDFEIPIAEWAGNGTVNLGAGAQVAYYFSTGNTWGTSNTSATTSMGPGGVLGGTTTPAGTGFNYQFTPTYPIQVGAIVELQTSPDGINWSNVPNATAGSINAETLRYDGTNSIGMAAAVTSTGKLRVDFGKYPYGVSSAYAGTWYWRVYVANPSSPVGFGIARAGDSGLINYYYEDDTTLAACTFQGNLGGSASSSIAIKITRIGRQVTLDIPSHNSVVPTTSSVALISNTNLPTWARPTVVKQTPTFTYNNGAWTTTMGFCYIATSGRIEFYRDISSTAYTNSANAGWYHTVITYTV